jgi:ribosomal protein S18 acetylase RimI-like enzyme/O-antigen ligase
VKLSASSAQPRLLDRIVIVELAICALPSLALIYGDRRAEAGMWLYLVLFAFLFQHLLRGKIASFGALIVGLIPVLMLLRGEFYYNMPIVLLVAFVVCWLVTTRGDASYVWSNVQVRLILLFTTGYWLISFALTGDYSSNLRALELSLTICAIWLLAGSRRHLLTALVGIIFSTLAICLAMMPFGERLGMASLGGYRLGNPISLGIPLALAVTLAIADGGKWLSLEGKTLRRAAIAVLSAGLLLLTTSRGGLAVLFGILLILLLAGRRQRRVVVVFAVLVMLTIPVLLATSRGQYLDDWYERTVSPDRTLSQVSSGRYDQWALFPRVFRESPLWGFGPGLGRFEYAKYSRFDDRIVYRSGMEAEWHSLYLQLGVETGLIGLLCLIGLVTQLLVVSFRHYRRTNEILPLLGIVGFLVVALSVSGMDAISGVLFGLGFLTKSPAIPNRKTIILQPAERMLALTRRQARRYLRSLMDIDAQILGERWTREQWFKDLPGKWEFSKFILRDLEPIGFVVASAKGEAIHVHRLAIRDLYRGKGRGKQLLHEVAKSAQQRSLPTMTLKVSRENERALVFYQRLGFQHADLNGDNIELSTSVTDLLAQLTP